MRKMYIYPTVGAFANDVNNAKTSKLFANGRGDDLDSQRVDERGWHGTKTYEEANKLLIDGDAKNAELIRNSGVIKSPKRTNEQIPIPKASVYGYRPHIPNFLAGIPEDMIATKQIVVRKKILTIVVCEAVNAGWSATELINVNAKIVTAIRMIESGGIRCNLYTLFASRKNAEEIGALVKVKESGRHLSIERMAYTMVNPAFFRRHFFRFLETRKELTDDAWTWGYGCPGSLDLCKSMLQDENFKYHYICHVGDLKSHTPEQIKEMFEQGNATTK